MRSFYASVLTLLALQAALLAQPPRSGSGTPLVPAPGSGNGAGATLGQPTLDPNSHLDAYLMRWEREMKDVNCILVRNIVRTDKTHGQTKVWSGEARYLKPNFAALRLILQSDRKIYEMMVSTGTNLYEYRPQYSKLVIHELPPAKIGAFDNNLLSFLFGMSAMDAKKRYDLTLSKDIGPDNPNYIYIDIKPRFVEDAREFARAQLVLFSSTMLPRRLWFAKSNDEETTWDLPDMDTKTLLHVTDFAPPDAPNGWQTEYQRLPPPGNIGANRPSTVRGGPNR
jgi:TIGR03009 family protein